MNSRRIIIDYFRNQKKVNGFTVTLDKKDLLNCLLWLEKEINFDDHLPFLNSKGTIDFNGEFSLRQFYTYRLAMIEMSRGNYIGALHEMIDFIHDYGRNIDEPLCIYERIMISMWIGAIKEMLNKD